MPSGGRLWRLKFYFGGKEKCLALGVWPKVSLKEARDAAAIGRGKLAQGIDPGEERREAKRFARREAVGCDTFRTVGDEWLDKMKGRWTPGHAMTVRSRLERDLLPTLGARPTAAITAPSRSPRYAGSRRAARSKSPIGCIKLLVKFSATPSRRDGRPGTPRPTSKVRSRPLAGCGKTRSFSFGRI